MSMRVLCPEGHPVVIEADELGEEVVCPRCRTSFVAEKDSAEKRPARAKKPKSSRARDDDDEEDEKPVKKAKARKSRADDDDEGGEPPRKRKPVRRRDDEDEDDEADDEPDSTDEPIEWTARKRQLKTASIGLTCYQVAYWAFLVGFALDAIAIILLIVSVAFALFGSAPGSLPEFAGWAEVAMLPAFAIAFLAQIVGWIFGLWSPAKSGARTSIILAILLFLAPVVLMLIASVLVGADFFRNVRVSERFLLLMGQIAALFTLASFIFSLQAVGRLGGFLQLPHIASQPVTAAWFIIGGIVFRNITQFVLMEFIFKSAASMDPKADLGGFILIVALVLMLLTEAIYVLVTRACYDLTVAIGEIKVAIDKYIKEG
jgi:hypothetical protein